MGLKEYLESAVKGGRPFRRLFWAVVRKKILGDCLLGRSSSSESRLTDAKILEEEFDEIILSILFFDDGCKRPDGWEYQLDIEDTKPEEAARKIRVYGGRSGGLSRMKRILVWLT